MSERNLGTEDFRKKEQSLKSSEEIRREKEYEMAKVKTGVLFKSYATGKERVKFMKESVEELAKIYDIKDTMSAELDLCANIQDKREFIERVFNITKPLIDLIFEKPELLEMDLSEESEEKDKYERILINELLVCDIEKNIIEIHIRPKEKLNDTLVKFKEGLEKVAEIINSHEEIELVKVQSWIIARHPRIAEKFGFVLGEEVKLETGEVVRNGHMSREDFLKRYLNSK
jgi:hypothetical protein